MTTLSFCKINLSSSPSTRWTQLQFVLFSVCFLINTHSFLWVQWFVKARSCSVCPSFFLSVVSCLSLLFPGGGSGIGRAVCQRLASEGASVVVADISEESANETMGSLRNNLRGQVHMAAVVDVSSKESVKKLVTSIQVWKTAGILQGFFFFFKHLCIPLQTQYFQPPSVCVTAAGITQDDFLLNMEEEKFDRVVQVNLKVADVSCPSLNEVLTK